MVEWKNSRYGHGASAELGHGLRIGVAYESSARLATGEPAFNVEVLGQRLANRSPTMDEAKTRAITVARKWLSDALDSLNDA